MLSICFGNAAPIDGEKTGTNLISTNFDKTIAKGMWLVEFFSPYCGHCKKFAPTWSLLVGMNEHLADSSDFHFGRVDCIAQGDLCTSNNIQGYPTVRLILDGKKVEEFEGERTYEALSTFILTHAKEHKSQIAGFKHL
ncbi:thioredoxin-domain-containing protein [Meira miltonrushii]|uniref:Thioredoxin-domain-containing protein n=1 Tax=Meira miltonrushii TaxID=1280837 RepID=A0A316VMZ3_9BASI|nr:thioredoxin-domain-containing protein [Meira miltonrushii]PWN38438.1 thioredoxin-domain-containing protein [Meira miltonrushii]